MRDLPCLCYAFSFIFLPQQQVLEYALDRAEVYFELISVLFYTVQFGVYFVSIISVHMAIMYSSTLL